MPLYPCSLIVGLRDLAILLKNIVVGVLGGLSISG